MQTKHIAPLTLAPPARDEALTYARDARLIARDLRELVSNVCRGDTWTDEQLAAIQDAVDQLNNRIVSMPAWDVAS